MAARINILGEIKFFKANIRILGIQINTKLRWGPHIKKIQKKMITQTWALIKITTSIWGASFACACQVYLVIIHPIMVYGSAILYVPFKMKGTKKCIMGKLAVLQNKCLRVVIGVYKATPIEMLEAKIMIPLMKEYFDLLQAKT